MSVALLSSEGMAYQSLYRRFRPQRFSEIIGQDHLVRALRNAVAEDRVGHAYLLSGPRGTGKTSTARILAMALNCERRDGGEPRGGGGDDGEPRGGGDDGEPRDGNGNDGEPCGKCDRCVSVKEGSSLDLIEIDAASHNSVNDIRELIAGVALGGAGRRKVYLLDEVHMLSAAAANALLKTLEEPPGHVVFILATTDPQKVLPTIRSRTQHIELSLVGMEELSAHLEQIAKRADITLTEDEVKYLVEKGAGSVRDALSALDQIVTAGGVPDDRTDATGLVKALAGGDLAAALTAVEEAVGMGADPRDLAERAARRLRDVFLVANGVEPGQLTAGEVTACGELGDRMGLRACVRALELLGEALSQMSQSTDRRLTLEVAVVRLLADIVGDDALRGSETSKEVSAEPESETGGSSSEAGSLSETGGSSSAARDSSEIGPVRSGASHSQGSPILTDEEREHGAKAAAKALAKLRQIESRPDIETAQPSGNAPIGLAPQLPVDDLGVQPPPIDLAPQLPVDDSAAPSSAISSVDLSQLAKEGTSAHELQAIRQVSDAFPGAYIVHNDRSQ